MALSRCRVVMCRPPAPRHLPSSRRPHALADAVVPPRDATAKPLFRARHRCCAGRRCALLDAASKRHHARSRRTLLATASTAASTGTASLPRLSPLSRSSPPWSRQDSVHGQNARVLVASRSATLGAVAGVFSSRAQLHLGASFWTRDVADADAAPVVAAERHARPRRARP